MKINKKIIVALFFILLVTLGIFARRDKYYYFADISSFSVRENTEISDSVDIQDGVLMVNAVGEAEDLDFDTIHTNIIEQPVPNLPFGVYEIEVKYRTDYADVSNVPSVSMGLISAGRDIREDSIALSERVYLEDYKTEIRVPVYVSQIDKTKDLRLVIYCSAPGTTSVESIEIIESHGWKLAIIIGEIVLAFAMLGLAVVIRKTTLEKKIESLVGVALVLFSSALAFNGYMGALGGDDMTFHINRIGCLANDIKVGNFMPLYQGNLGYGAGYIASTMYSNLFLYPAAILHILGLPLYACYNANIVLVNIITYFVCMYSFKGLFGKNRYALFGTALYMLSMYRLVDCYYRAAVGEFTAMAFLPLVAYGIYHIYYQVEQAKIIDILPLAFGVSGVLESHILTTEMMSIFIIIFAVWNYKDTIKKIKPLFMAAVVSCLINAFFLIPFLDAYRQPLAINSDTVSRALMHTGNTLCQTMGLLAANRRTLGYNPTCLGFASIIVIAGYILFCIVSRNETYNHNKMASQSFVFAALALWMASVYCPWNLLAGKSNIICKLLMSIQFNYRYYEFAFLFLAIIGAYLYKSCEEILKGIKSPDRHVGYFSPINGIVLLIVLSLLFGAGDFYAKIIPEAEYKEVYSTVTNLKTDELYCNVNFDAFARDPKIYLMDESVGKINKAGITCTGEKLFDVQLSSAIDAVLPIAYYKNIKVVEINSGEEIVSDCSTDGKVLVHFQQGCDEIIKVEYKVKWSYYLGRGISLLVGIALVGYYLKTKKR